MKISVIIPVKNREHTIKETIESILLSNYPNLEIIVVDNNSTDKTSEIVKKFQNVIYVKNEIDRERSYSRNLGIKISTGDFITFIDSDDTFSKEIFDYFKKKQAKYFKDKFFFINYNFLEKNSIKHNQNSFKKKICTIKELVNSNLISNIGIFVSKDLALDNFWDESKYIIGTEDYDFVLRLMIKCNRAILVNKKPLGYVRIHDGRSVYNDKILKILKRFFFFKKKIYTDLIFKKLNTFNKKKIISTQALYASLLLLNCGERSKSGYFLLLAIRENKFCIFSKRFFYLIYKLVIRL